MLPPSQVDIRWLAEGRRDEGLSFPAIGPYMKSGVNNISYMQHKNEAYFSTFIQS